MHARTWTTWRLAPGRYVLELDDRRTPPGLALELEVAIVDGRTVAMWRLSQTGAVLAAGIGAQA